MKRVVFFILMLAALYTALLSPINIREMMGRKEQLQEALDTYSNSQRALDTAKSALRETQQRYINKRVFEVAYSDVSRLTEVLNSVINITVSAVNTADPAQNFIAGGTWTEGTESKAVILSLTVEDSVSALRVIDKMELPIYEITVSEPNIVNITFLTGGADA